MDAKIHHWSGQCDVPNQNTVTWFFLVFWLRLCKSHPLENEKFTKTMSRLSRKDSLALKKRNLGCTVIDLVMKIKPFKGVNTKA